MLRQICRPRPLDADKGAYPKPIDTDKDAYQASDKVAGQTI